MRNWLFKNQICRSQGLVSVDPEKLNAINDIPIPTTLKQLRSFCGAVYYIRKFIVNCSSHLAKLMDIVATCAQNNVKKLPNEQMPLIRDQVDIIKRELCKCTSIKKKTNILIHKH